MLWVFVIIIVLLVVFNRSGPKISNLRISSGNGTPVQILQWDETGAVRRTVYFTSEFQDDNITGIEVGEATANLTNGGPIRTVRVTVYSLNDASSAFAEINLSNPCFLGDVSVYTSQGSQKVKDLQIGSQLLQLDGTYSSIKEIKKSTVTGVQSDDNHRIYADSENKLMVTYWHKVRFINEPEEVMAGKHSKLHEIEQSYPFDVYNFVLDTYTDKILIYESEIVAESFSPVNPA